ncbi:MAG: 3-deoxy-8-phosphooctulonate synthase [Bdellovibrionales bacterium RIFOXYD1_FULL_53_11]|nr:MAG: 3-deoxy-8-phosphooctulonate synthase [Bdellovibrionales bacterium RIFOXYD1_FULL_53_11]
MVVTNNSPMTLLAGLCILEDEGLALEVARDLKRQLDGLPVRFYFKASFDKANRTSIESYRGPGMTEGLRILEHVKRETGLPLCVDFHEPSQAERVAEVADVLQVPAFLCRQTDMISAGVSAVLRRGGRLNVKKGQFLSPLDMRNVVEKARAVQNKSGVAPDDDWLAITERGTSFGYNSLIVDMSGFKTVQSFGVPVIYDATHSVQIPGAAPGGRSTGGRREALEVLARAAMAAGADGLFFECHPDPARARSDGPNALPLRHAGAFVRNMIAIRDAARALPGLDLA